jgi:hypothetical protein
VKQLALHLLGDDLSLLSRQRDAATNGLVLYAESHPGADFPQLLDGFNEQWATAATFFSTELLRQLLDLTGGWTATYYEQVDPFSLGEPVAFFGTFEPAPYWQIASREFMERWVHQHQIRRAVGQPDLGPELLAAAGGVLAKGISLTLGDLGAPAGTTLDLEVPGVARWSLQRETGRDGWALRVDGAGDAQATISFAADTAVALFSRAPTVAGAGPPVSVRGDRELGDAALTSIVALFG